MESECPAVWTNIASAVRDEFPLPAKDSAGTPVERSALAGLYSEECSRIELLEGEYGNKAAIPIPGEVMDQYRKYRATPLCRARGLERRLGYAGRILYKREDCNPGGSHKPNTAIPQAYYAKKQGLRTLVTDTGAGQWGVAVAFAARLFSLKCVVFMTRKSYEDKPYRVRFMRLLGAEVHPSPSGLTANGRKLLRRSPRHRGSLGVGMGEAVEMLRTLPGSRLALGCMSYYAALHQSVIGLELVEQLRHADCRPDALIACVGGGSNLVGFMAPFLLRAFKGMDAPEMVAAESANVPVLTRGEYRYDHADSFGLTPKLLMYTLGHKFVPPAMHSGGLRYHGKTPLLSLAVRKGLVKAQAVGSAEAARAGRIFLECEGVLAAPESSHAIAAAIRAAAGAKREGRRKDIVFCLSGTGYLDLAG